MRSIDWTSWLAPQRRAVTAAARPLNPGCGPAPRMRPAYHPSRRKRRRVARPAIEAAVCNPRGSEERLLLLDIPGPGLELVEFGHELPGGGDLQVFTGETDVGDLVEVAELGHDAGADDAAVHLAV